MGNGVLPHGPSDRAHPRLYLSGGKGMSAFAPLVFLTRVSRSTAQQPATSGVAMLVPASKKNAGSDEVPNTLLGVAARERVDRMPVPGATMSGLIRRSLVGPRLLKAAIPLRLFAMRSANSGLCGKEFGRIPP